MNTRRANVLRSILSLAAMGGGMPIGLGVPRQEPKAFPEAQALAIDLGVSYDEAELAFLRFGETRARELIGICQRHNVHVSNEVIDFIDRNSPRQRVDMLDLIERCRLPVKDQRDVAPYRATHGARSLAEKKARRAKRKQRSQR